MTLALFLIVTLLAIGVPKESVVHPEAASLLTNGEPQALDCQPAPGPDSVLDEAKASRTANFRATGRYECRRPVFSAEERDPYTDRALEAANTNAKVTAQKLGHLDLVGVRIEGDLDDSLRSRLAAIYRNELETTLGSDHVLRSPETNAAPNAAPNAAIVVVEVLKIESSGIVARVRLSRTNDNGEVTWQDL